MVLRYFKQQCFKYTVSLNSMVAHILFLIAIFLEYNQTKRKKMTKFKRRFYKYVSNKNRCHKD